MVGIAKRHNAVHEQTDKLQFRLLLMIVFVWFFTAAVGNKLMRRTPEGGRIGESCFTAAKRAAYSAVPNVFARV